MSPSDGHRRTVSDGRSKFLLGGSRICGGRRGLERGGAPWSAMAGGSQRPKMVKAACELCAVFGFWGWRPANSDCKTPHGQVYNSCHMDWLIQTSCIQSHLDHVLQGLMQRFIVLRPDLVSVPQIYLKAVAQPPQPQLDVRPILSCLVQENAGVYAQQVRRY